MDTTMDEEQWQKEQMQRGGGEVVQYGKSMMDEMRTIILARIRMNEGRKSSRKCRQQLKKQT